jgi:hypothetical protein
MKILILACLSLMFAACSTGGKSVSQTQMSPRNIASNPAGYLDPHDLSIINLNHVSIIDSENQNTFPYSVAAMETASQELLQKLLTETGGDVILSRLFVASSLPVYKSIYVFITQEIVSADNSNFTLNVRFENNKGHVTTLHYRIVDASQRVLSLTHGPSDELEHLEARADGSFFPIAR